MFGTRHRSYAAGMERNPSANNRVAFPQSAITRRSVGKAWSGFTLRYVKAIAQGCGRSGAFYPYWIATGRLSAPHAGDATTR